MPISMPAHLIDSYGGDADHFRRVLETLHIPAVEAAGYEAWSPLTVGSAEIRADIVQNLQNADMLLCDASALNANVYFEWGIRTALNLPVALVKDDLTATLPFDVGSIQYESYSSAMKHWTVERDRNTIAKHIGVCFSKSQGRNSLWRHFGLQQAAAKDLEVESGQAGVLELVLQEVQGLKTRLDETHSNSYRTFPAGKQEDRVVIPAKGPLGYQSASLHTAQRVKDLLKDWKFNVRIVSASPESVTLAGESLEDAEKVLTQRYLKEKGFPAKFAA